MYHHPSEPEREKKLYSRSIRLTKKGKAPAGGTTPAEETVVSSDSANEQPSSPETCRKRSGSCFAETVHV
eukprot:2439378-Prymnesium_polylepis.1